jgi:hypothetical protein
MRIVPSRLDTTMRPVLLILPLFSITIAAHADDGITSVEVKAAPTLQQRRADGAGRIIVPRGELTRYGDSTQAAPNS